MMPLILDDQQPIILFPRQRSDTGLSTINEGHGFVDALSSMSEQARFSKLLRLRAPRPLSYVSRVAADVPSAEMLNRGMAIAEVRCRRVVLFELNGAADHVDRLAS
jgi:hypothetical protein